MKQLFLAFCFFVFLFVSCSKDKTETSQPEVAILLQKHDWIFDSGFSIIPDGTKRPNTVLQNIGETLSFNQNTYTITFHAPPYNVVLRNYKAEAPATLYFWDQGSAMSKDTFAIIESVTDKNLVIYEAHTNSSGDSERDYYHAQ